MVSLNRFYRYAAVLVGLVHVQAQEAGDSAQYIVTLRKDLPQAEVDNHIEWVADVHRSSTERHNTPGIEREYTIGGFHAYSGGFDDQTIEQIRSSGNVESVEPDELQNAVDALVQQTDAPYGLASLSTPTLPKDTLINQTYIYDDSAGEGMWAYVMDSGVMVENSEFEGRAIKGVNIVTTEPFTDGLGHGTHCAGTVGSKTFGVAKKANIVDVKGSGQPSQFLEGLEWTVNNITGTPGRAERSVLSISLGYTRSTAIESAMQAAYDAGILAAVSAGNSGSATAWRSPGTAPVTIATGAANVTKSKAAFSNFGPMMDIFASGVNVVSVSTTEGRSVSMSGTSMAAPHIAGLVLYLKALEGLSTPAGITARVKELALKDIVLGAGEGSPNLFAYNGAT